MPKGPRIYFKTDAESSIGRGAVMYGAHFRPEISRMIWSAAAASSEISDCSEVHVTEGHRKIRDTRDLHEECRALDFTFRTMTGYPPDRAEYDWIAQRMQVILGVDYDVIAHGEGANLHIHVELDP